jgi:hypothetical protein
MHSSRAVAANVLSAAAATADQHDYNGTVVRAGASVMIHMLYCENRAPFMYTRQTEELLSNDNRRSF